MAKKNISFNSTQLRSLLLGAITPITHHSTVIMTVASVGVLIYTIMAVNTIITKQDDPEYRLEQATNRINGNFDKATIDKIDNLKPSSDTSTITLPDGRRNPFIN